jgi:hypothetical protein
LKILTIRYVVLITPGVSQLKLNNSQLETREGFLRKPMGCRAGLRRRDV